MTDQALKIMVVEDEALLAMDMERTLNKLGHDVLGPFDTSAEAKSALSTSLPDLAFLDVNLGNGGDSMDVAGILHERSVPFAFLTGYAASATVIGTSYPDVERLAKPCSPVALGNAVARLAMTRRSSP